MQEIRTLNQPPWDAVKRMNEQNLEVNISYTRSNPKNA